MHTRWGANVSTVSKGPFQLLSATTTGTGGFVKRRTNGDRLADTRVSMTVYVLNASLKSFINVWFFFYIHIHTLLTHQCMIQWLAAKRNVIQTTDKRCVQSVICSLELETEYYYFPQFLFLDLCRRIGGTVIITTFYGFSQWIASTYSTQPLNACGWITK